MTAVNEINVDIKRIDRWAAANGLILNASKSLAILISRSNAPVIIPPLHLNNSVIPISDYVRDLGFTVDTHLNWSQHSRVISAKVYSGLRRLWCLSSVIPRDTKIKLVQSLLIPHFTYGDVLFGELCSSSKRTIEQAFNACVRFAFGLKRYGSVAQYRC